LRGESPVHVTSRLTFVWSPIVGNLNYVLTGNVGLGAADAA